MKLLLAICVAVLATFVGAAEKPAAAPPSGLENVKGEVLEVIDASVYTYMRLKTKNGEVWTAVAKAPIKVGSQVTVENAVAMKDFNSKSLNRTFPLIMLGNLPGTAAAPPLTGDAMAAAHSGVVKPTVDLTNIKVAKATGANAQTVAEILTKSAALKDKPVLVRGKVVKYSESIMGKNWVHLRDGTGSDKDKSNDILVTTKDDTMVGQIVTAKGTVRTDKDFGAGYSYKVLVEDATLQK